ncbi:LysR family transcriptional regulator [Cohnella panacarvi]|uniref:LysR family transcriptional regulator n=1 Tax=Cohnella panacarvi TaxID=400776 RepID=UPI000479ED75|nr:LysR substrate-binding domain-containing protein [Cohnella panacarvi]
MELRQLEYFVAVCEELHFTRAAERLNISQPSLSQQIRILEHNVGLPLFDRIGKKTIITESGQILLKHCYNVFHELEQARSAIAELQGLTRGSLKIGAIYSVMNDLLPPAILSFQQSYPQVELSLFGLRNGDIIHMLLHNEIDMGIIIYPTLHDELVATYLYDERLAIAVPDNHPLAGCTEIKLESLHHVPVIALQKTYYLREYMDRVYKDNDIVPRVVMELNTMDSIICMVGQGAGVTVLPLPYLQASKQAAIRVIPIADPNLSIKIGMAYRRNKYLCAASRVFMEQIIVLAKQRNCL